MKRRSIIIAFIVLCLILGIAWALAYFVAWQIGMGVLTFILIAAWTADMLHMVDGRNP